jgi:hypothetical protein
LFCYDELGSFITDLLIFCDEIRIVMEAISIYNNMFWSLMMPLFRHNPPPDNRPNVAVNGVIFCDGLIWSQIELVFRHHL